MDLIAGPTLTFGGKEFVWKTSNECTNCITPADALYINGVQGLNITFKEIERIGMVGLFSVDKLLFQLLSAKFLNRQDAYLR